uniref:Glutathione peroxidase n=1 Tax=Panagrellus redivivus TaxID=6233 RepID=A0A7E4V486_PANRE
MLRAVATRLVPSFSLIGFASLSSMADKTIYQFTVKDSDGADVSLDRYKGKVVLIVNVASSCGLTDANYKQLKEILDKYHDKGFEVAAFPCNQFGGQESGCQLDIKNFVTDKYKFDPDLYEKINVNGDDASPLYKFLKKEKGGTLFDAIKWNFTKFLVDREGKVVQRYGPQTEPKTFVKDIEALL